MSTTMRRTSPNQFIEVRAERLEGAPVGGRRRWSDAFKDRAVAASLEPGVNISALARDLEITPAQLFSWRSAAAKRVATRERGMAPALSGPKARRVEVEVGGVVLRVPTDIGEDDLRRLVRAVREA